MPYTMREGDQLYRRKNIAMHVGTACSNGMVIHNSPMHGTRATTFAEFAQGKPVYVVRRRSTLEPGLNPRAVSLMSKQRQYDLFANNCEHAAAKILGEVPSSPQACAALAGAALSLIVKPSDSVGKAVVVGAIGAALGLTFINAVRHYDEVIPIHRLEQPTSH